MKDIWLLDGGQKKNGAFEEMELAAAAVTAAVFMKLEGPRKEFKERETKQKEKMREKKPSNPSISFHFIHRYQI